MCYTNGLLVLLCCHLFTFTTYCQAIDVLAQGWTTQRHWSVSSPAIGCRVRRLCKAVLTARHVCTRWWSSVGTSALSSGRPSPTWENSSTTMPPRLRDSTSSKIEPIYPSLQCLVCLSVTKRSKKSIIVGNSGRKKWPNIGGKKSSPKTFVYVCVHNIIYSCGRSRGFMNQTLL